MEWVGFARCGWDNEYNEYSNTAAKTWDVGYGQAVNGKIYVKGGSFVRIEKTEKNGEWIIDLGR